MTMTITEKEKRECSHARWSERHDRYFCNCAWDLAGRPVRDEKKVPCPFLPKGDSDGK